jgi:hypothetical protein
MDRDSATETDMAAVAEARLAAVALLLAGLWVEWQRRRPWPEDEVNKRN